MPTETRNPDERITDTENTDQGVGGRQENRGPLPWGGGYLDICEKKTRAVYASMLKDPRMNELREYGLSDAWLELAEALGYDSFLVAWQILDKKNILMDHHDNARIRVPIFARYLKHQRNKYIIHLSMSGKSPDEIKLIIKKELCEDVTEYYISRLIRRFKIEK